MLSNFLVFNKDSHRGPEFEPIKRPDESCSIHRSRSRRGDFHHQNLPKTQNPVLKSRTQLFRENLLFSRFEKVLVYIYIHLCLYFCMCVIA